MRFDPGSSAPHLHPASAWEQASLATAGAHATTRAAGIVLYRSSDGTTEAGIDRWPKGPQSLELHDDMLCYFIRGRGRFHTSAGETIEAAPEMTVHLKSGWQGEIEVIETLEASYMRCQGAPGATAILHDALHAAPLKDWGKIPTMLEGNSHTAGILLSRDADGRAESGLWTCTPGLWRCEVTSDEFCHFLDGRCLYMHESGEQIEIAPDTLAFFPAGWRGSCEVKQTARKIYMIR